MEILQPVQRVLDEESDYFITLFAIEIHRLSPRSLIAVSEVRSEVGEVVSFRTEMVVDDVQNDRQPFLMASVNETLQAPRSSITVLNCKWKNAIVAPVSSAGELCDRHQFDGSQAQRLPIHDV